MNARLITLLIAISPATYCFAEGGERLAGQDHGSVSIGTYGRSLSTTLRIDSVAGQGTSIDLNKKFGIGRKVESGRIDLSYRFGRRDRTELSYYRNSTGKSFTLDSDITVGGTTFNQGSGIAFNHSTDELQWRWKRAIWLEDKYDVGFSFGVHALSEKFSVNTTGGASKRAKVDAVLPLPLIGLYGEYYFSPLWSVQGSYELLALEIGGYKGNVGDFRLSADYKINDRVSVGAGYASFQVKVSADVPNFNGELKNRYYGLRVYATYRF